MAITKKTVSVADLKKQLQDELTGNILPFWMKYTVDKDNGGFYGAVTNDLRINNDIPRSSILCARILWTYATAYQKLGEEKYLSMARTAYEYLTQVFWDQDYDGVYWQVDYQGKPVLDRKHHYAQAFAIYALSEYYRATGKTQSLMLAKRLFELLEKFAYEPLHKGYIEGSSRNWQTLQDMRLSEKEIHCRKSMNTMLHILEAYSNLLRVWDDGRLKKQHKSLIEVFQDHIVNPDSGHFNLFFDDSWNSLCDHISFGHDIEGSWLLWEAAELQNDPDLSTRTRKTVTFMAEAVYKDGLDSDGSLFYESGPQGLVNSNKDWWVQAETVVGFYNAFQLTGKPKFKQAAFHCWNYIQNKLIDRKYGDWFKSLSRDGTSVLSMFKAGPWECPYHHSRVCFEMLRRLDEPLVESTSH